MLPYSDYVELAHATLQATVICVQEGAEGAVEQPQPADGALRPAGPADTATAVPAARHTDQSVAEVLLCSYLLYPGFSVTECRPVIGCS